MRAGSLASATAMWAFRGSPQSPKQGQDAAPKPIRGLRPDIGLHHYPGPRAVFSNGMPGQGKEWIEHGGTSRHYFSKAATFWNHATIAPGM